VVLKGDDFRLPDIEATQSVDIMEFVPLKKLNQSSSTQPIIWSRKRKAQSVRAVATPL
jgi:hypothetical protein